LKNEEERVGNESSFAVSVVAEVEAEGEGAASKR
jgi:hypothetical protein